MIRAQIVAESRTWLETPFKHQGRVKGAGVDCAGLIVGVCHALGLSSFDKHDYDAEPDGVMLRATCEREMTAIPVAGIQPGDVLLFAFGGRPTHLAFVADYVHGGLSIVHGYSVAGKVIEQRMDSVWRRRIVAAYKLPGVE